MNYSINYEGNVYELPQYNAGTIDKIEKVKNTINNKVTTKDKAKVMYDFILDMIGIDNIAGIMSTFNDTDLNTINIVYESILYAYNSPLREYKAEKTAEVLQDINIEQISQLSNLLQSLNSGKFGR